MTLIPTPRNRKYEKQLKSKRITMLSTLTAVTSSCL